jgi:ABC-2 type transport system permease protein
MGSAISLFVAAILLGLIINHLTRNENLAYGVSLAIMIVVVITYFIDSTKFEGLIPDIMTKLSLFDRFSTFVNGIFDMTGIVYYLTVIAFFLFLSVQSLEKRRYN